MKTDLVKDFNYMLHYFNIKDKIYIPKELPYTMCWWGWNTDNGRHTTLKYMFIDLDFDADPIDNALMGMYSSFDNNKRHWDLHGNKIKYYED